MATLLCALTHIIEHQMFNFMLSLIITDFIV